MGHEMTGTDQMYSVREAPWHLGSGTNVLMLDAVPETRMARIEAAGHAFTVEERDVYLRHEQEAEGREEPEPPSRSWRAGRRSPARTPATCCTSPGAVTRPSRTSSATSCSRH